MDRDRYEYRKIIINKSSGNDSSWRHNYRETLYRRRRQERPLYKYPTLNPPPLALLPPKLLLPNRAIGERRAIGLQGGLLEKSSGEVDSKLADGEATEGLPVVRALTRRARVPWLLERQVCSPPRSLSPRLTMRDDPPPLVWPPVGETHATPLS